MIGLWRPNIDFWELNTPVFSRFETVFTELEMVTLVGRGLSPFTVPTNFSTVLAEAIYDYCWGKVLNLKDETRWKKNVSGEVKVWLLENGRYLQAYARDVNQNINQDNTSKTTTVGEEIAGKVDTKKTGHTNNNQISNVTGSNKQEGQEELGDTLTVLNNQTTSTRLLASSNEEAYSRGSVNESTSTSFGKSDSVDINLGVENGASLSDQKHQNIVDVEGTKSPLEIALQEGNFNFKDWVFPLLIILDSYFSPGGVHYA